MICNIWKIWFWLDEATVEEIFGWPNLYVCIGLSICIGICPSGNRINNYARIYFGMLYNDGTED